jgi:hypothetical protein
MGTATIKFIRSFRFTVRTINVLCAHTIVIHLFNTTIIVLHYYRVTPNHHYFSNTPHHHYYSNTPHQHYYYRVTLL